MAPLGAVAYKTRGRANLVGRHAGDFLHRLRRIVRRRHELLPRLEFGQVASRGRERLVGESLGHHDVSDCVDQRDVGAGADLQMVRRLHVWQTHDFGDARIDDDKFRALADSAFHLRRENRVTLGDVRADHHNHVGLHHRVEVLRRRGSAERGLESVAGRRMTNARAGIDVVVAKRGAHQFLNEESFLVGASRGRDTAECAAPVFFLDALELGRGVFDRVVPGHFAPRLGDRFANHRTGDTIRMGGVAPRETALDARVAVIGLAVGVRHHPRD